MIRINSFKDTEVTMADMQEHFMVEGKARLIFEPNLKSLVINDVAFNNVSMVGTFSRWDSSEDGEENYEVEIEISKDEVQIARVNYYFNEHLTLCFYGWYDDNRNNRFEIRKHYEG